MIEWICSATTAFWMCSLKSMVGLAAKGRTSASTTPKSSSGIGASHAAGPLLQAREEPLDLLPDLSAPAQALPVGADETHQPVALVDGDQEVIPGTPHAVDQQRLDVRLHLLQDRVALRDVLPGLQRKERFGRAHGTWIERDHASGAAIVAEEGHVHRHVQALPLRIRHVKTDQVQVAGGDKTTHATAGRSAVEEHGTGPARTLQLPRRKAQEMPMLGTNGLAAQVTVLPGIPGCLPRE